MAWDFAVRVSRRIQVLPAAFVLVVLAGCGGASGGSDFHAAVSSMRTVLVAYDRSPQSNVTDTARACRQAHDQLSGDSALLHPPSTGPNVAAGRALGHAYQDALAGLADCAGSAPYNYVRMALAQREIATANVWLARARRLER